VLTANWRYNYCTDGNIAEHLWYRRSIGGRVTVQNANWRYSYYTDGKLAVTVTVQTANWRYNYCKDGQLAVNLLYRRPTGGTFTV
jgi:YD repeat-containing protein